MSTSEEITRAVHTVRNKAIEDLAFAASFCVFLFFYGHGVYAIARYIIGG